MRFTDLAFIALMAVVTYATRAGGLLLPPAVLRRRAVEHGLRVLAGSALAAIVGAALRGGDPAILAAVAAAALLAQARTPTTLCLLAAVGLAAAVRRLG